MGTSKCKQGQGDCNSDEDCEGDLRCGRSGYSCGAGFKDNMSCCVAPICDGSMRPFHDDDCCGHIRCEEGEGHCKNDDQCAGDLVCGKDNCPAPFYSHQDCCMKPTTGTMFR